MKKIIWITILIIVLILLSGWFLIVESGKRVKNNIDNKDRVCVKNICYIVQVAKTVQEQERGLMFRSELASDQGMIFEFEQPGAYPFWMKNTLIPLDIVWIGADKKINYISKNTPPCDQDSCPLYGSQAPAKYVLEINAGQIDLIGAAIGDEVTIK